jgi:lysophospholipase L1-like esterase
MIPFVMLPASSSVTAGQALRNKCGPHLAEMWNSSLAESVGDDTADAAVVALDVSTPQGRRRKMVVSIGMNDLGTTPTQARLNVLADVNPQCRVLYTEMQRICCNPLFVLKVDTGDGRAALLQQPPPS